MRVADGVCAASRLAPRALATSAMKGALRLELRNDSILRHCISRTELSPERPVIYREAREEREEREEFSSVLG